MINNKTVVAIIPARGGSKGVKRKNLRNVGGKPLIAWTIEEARKSKYLDRVILSSEDDEIIDIAMKYGCDVPFKRPVELARDDTPGIEPVLHALSQIIRYDYVVLLQPTSPLRNADDIDKCIANCISINALSLVSVKELDTSPYWMLKLDYNGNIHPLLNKWEESKRRQELPVVYALNGAVYVAKYEWLIKNRNFLSKDTKTYIMPAERSIDIDSEFDLKMVNYIKMEEKNENS